MYSRTLLYNWSMAFSLYLNWSIVSHVFFFFFLVYLKSGPVIYSIDLCYSFLGKCIIYELWVIMKQYYIKRWDCVKRKLSKCEKNPWFKEKYGCFTSVPRSFNEMEEDHKQNMVCHLVLNIYCFFRHKFGGAYMMLANTKLYKNHLFLCRWVFLFIYS